MPTGAANVNVHGRHEVGALQGFGPLWQKTYRVPLTNVEVTPTEVLRAWKERCPEFQPSQSRFYPSLVGVAPGEGLLISASLRGMPVYTGVRVIYADDESFTVMTPEGHLESGWPSGVPECTVGTIWEHITVVGEHDEEIGPDNLRQEAPANNAKHGG